MNAVPKLAIVASNTGEIEGGAPALVPPGEYRLKFETWSTALMFGRSPKLKMEFKIMDFGEHFERRLPRWYNVKRVKGKPRREGEFSIGWTCDLMRDYARLVGLPHRTDRIYLARLSKVMIVGKVETVTTDRTQRKLPIDCHYSVVRELLRTEQ